MKPAIPFGALLVACLFASSELDAADERYCIDGGRLIHLDTDSSNSHDIKTSRDRTFSVITNYDADSFKVFDLKTNQIKEFSKPSGSAVSLLENDEIAFTKFDALDVSSAKSAFETVKKAKSEIVDPKTGQKREIVGKFVFGNSLFSAVSYEEPGTVVIKDNDGKMRKIQFNNAASDTVMRYAEDSSEPEVTYNKKDTTLQIKDGEKILFSGNLKYDRPNWIPGGFSHDKRKFITPVEQRNPDGSVKDYKLVVIDLNKRFKQSYELPPNYRGGIYSPSDSARKISRDSRYLLLNSHSLPNDGIKVMDLETGKISTFAKLATYDPYFDESDNVCGDSKLFTERKSVHECFNLMTGATVSHIDIPLESGNVKSLSPTDFIVSVWGGGNGQQGQSYYFSHRKICPNSIPPVECDCLIPNQGKKSVNLEVVKDLTLAMNCSKDFVEADWENLPSSDFSSLNEKSSLILLKRFSKPGGFDANRHTGLLLGMLKAGIHKKYPSEFKGALGGVIYNLDRLYDSLLTKYPEIANLPEKPDQSCQTYGEKEKISKAIADFVKARILSARRPKFSQFETVVSLAKDTLSEEKKISIAELAARQLIFSAGDSAELNRVFPSKVYKFAENKMKDALGLKFKNLTDLTVVRDAENLVFYQLGIKPFGGSSETIAGFHIKPVKTVSVASLPENKNKESFAWNYSGQEYTAEIGIYKQKLERQIVTHGKAPNYSEMWREKEFRGVIIAGSNLGTGVTDSVMKEYIDYYTQQGFKFDDPKTSDDIPEFLQEGVSGAKPMHYFVKEAHSDGDEKNLFRVGKQGKILRGVRQVGDKKEIVDLVYPTGNTQSVLLSNQDFGNWIKTREKKGQPELVYLNSSCWSKSKAVYEISAAASPTLINIPTTTSMVTFSNNEKNVMHAAIDGLRNQKSYEGIREDMKKDSKYESKIGNVFVFPDEDEYKRQVTDVLKVPVDLSVKLFVKKAGGSQVPYSIEETH